VEAEEMGNMIEWHDLNEELKLFIEEMARRHGISKDEIQTLVRLIFEYGFQCYKEGHDDCELEEALFEEG
jgi:hypothetical protein